MSTRTEAEAFRDWVADRFGLGFDDTRLAWLGELLARHAGKGGVGSYVRTLEQNPESTGPLAGDLTVGETFFFRNGSHFEALREHVLADRLRVLKVDRPLSVLSAGCSSGEEPYSLAMLLRESLPSGTPVSIRAVDLNPTALARAVAGRYGKWSLRETAPDRLARWFRSRRGEMELDPSIRAMVTFLVRNLADPDADIWQPGAYDIVFCRNVIMYFTPQVQRAVVARIAQSLRPGGYLFLGHAESLRSISQRFRLVHTNGTFYYRLRSEAAAADIEPELPPAPRRDEPPPRALPENWHQEIAAASGRVEQLVAGGSQAGEENLSPVETGSPAEEIAALIVREDFAGARDRIAALPAPMTDPAIEILEAVVFVHTGRLMAAAEACRRILARNEFDCGASYLLGVCLEQAGDVGSALQHYDIAIQLDPSFAMAVLRRGLLARRLGNIPEARADLDRAGMLIADEDTSRLRLFAGGFSRAALIQLCAAELARLGRAA